MPWTPRGGRALSRAASGRVPGPRTTDSSLNGIMLLIIFVTVLMVASFEHSLLREQRLADGRVVEIPNVATVARVERFVETEAKAIEQFVGTATKVAPRRAVRAPGAHEGISARAKPSAFTRVSHVRRRRWRATDAGVVRAARGRAQTVDDGDERRLRGEESDDARGRVLRVRAARARHHLNASSRSSSRASIERPAVYI